MKRSFVLALTAALLIANVGTSGNSKDQAVLPISCTGEKTKNSVTIAEYVTDPETAPEIMYYEELDIEMLARLMYQECGGVPGDTEKACVAWTVLNRVDDSGESIAEVITSPRQFAYYEKNPVTDELYELAGDVLSRWNKEKNGGDHIGRVLPPDYLWFSGDGRHNYFRNAYNGNFSVWDYSLTSPYES